MTTYKLDTAKVLNVDEVPLCEFIDFLQKKLVELRDCGWINVCISSDVDIDPKEGSFGEVEAVFVIQGYRPVTVSELNQPKDTP